MKSPAVVLSAVEASVSSPKPQTEKTVFSVLAAISFCHLLNDLLQSLIPAIYPLLKSGFDLNFTQIGLITFTFQMTASLLQPVIGAYTDKHPKPYSLAVGMILTLIGLVLMSRAANFASIIIAAAMVGSGSAVFHPESSRVARMASGGQHGFAQSFFQVGGNAGSAVGPLLAAFIVVPHGQSSLIWFSLVALLAFAILTKVGNWYANHQRAQAKSGVATQQEISRLPAKTVVLSIGILMMLIFSKYFYLVSLTSYYTFYLIEKFHISVQNAQIHLFVLLGAVAAGTIIGGPIGDRFGRKYVIWGSILGVLPFTLMLPYANLFWTGILSVVIGLILASAFSAILVYAQELVPGKVGLISGLFFGFAFGMAGIGAAVLGKLADQTSIIYVYHVCSFLPLIGLLTGFLPDMKQVTKSPVQEEKH
jgi:FSR family fosmidomycin resistance protein-like MFS transporter